MAKINIQTCLKKCWEKVGWNELWIIVQFILLSTAALFAMLSLCQNRTVEEKHDSQYSEMNRRYEIEKLKNSARNNLQYQKYDDAFDNFEKIKSLDSTDSEGYNFFMEKATEADTCTRKVIYLNYARKLKNTEKVKQKLEECNAWEE